MFNADKYDETTGHYAGNLDLSDYTHPLPVGLASVGGYLYLSGYSHPLPAGLASVGGGIYLSDYTHPLPVGLASVGGDLYLRGYTHPLPVGLASVGGNLHLRDYTHPLPVGLASVGGYLYLSGYSHPLAAGLASVGGDLYLDGYSHPLPAGLAGDITIPIIPEIDAQILAAIENGGTLEMGDWHTCDITHCRAGWAIHLAGENGRLLEMRVGSAAAGALIYQASRGSYPDFYALNDVAMADLRQCAGKA